jgi:hypothetical protein
MALTTVMNAQSVPATSGLAATALAVTNPNSGVAFSVKCSTPPAGSTQYGVRVQASYSLDGGSTYSDNVEVPGSETASQSASTTQRYTFVQCPGITNVIFTVHNPNPFAVTCTVAAIQY